MEFTSQHLLSINSLSSDSILKLLSDAKSILDNKFYLSPQTKLLQHKTLVNLFYEPSTRTRVSFELAAKRLGAEVVNIAADHSSIVKGESLFDTVCTLREMGCSLFVIRHPENGVVESLAQQIGSGVGIINAGDGTFEHPSQALLDVLAIRQKKSDLSQLTIAIVGDVLHSRVANSQMAIFKKCQVKELRLVAPIELMPKNLSQNIITTTNLKEGISGADVIIVLRIQKERMFKFAEKQFDQEQLIESYKNQFGLTFDKLKFAKTDAVILHPGPMNRGIEIESSVADGPQSLIKDQVACGVAMRMAILANIQRVLSTMTKDKSPKFTYAE